MKMLIRERLIVLDKARISYFIFFLFFFSLIQPPPLFPQCLEVELLGNNPRSCNTD